MPRFVKIGPDVINLDAISRIAFMYAQSGISDRLVIEVGASTIVIDSELIGRQQMEEIGRKLLAALSAEDWDQAPVERKAA